MFPRHPFVVPVCLLLFGLSACHKAPDEKGKASAAALVTTQVLAPSTWSDTLQALGTVKAHESVTLTAKLSEIVEAVHFESGQQVAAGQVLVTLRGNAQQAALQEAQAEFGDADALYVRQRELAEKQLIARSALDTLKAQRDAAEARVRQMQSDIGDRQVRAPFAGVVGIRQVSPGSLVTVNSTIATLDDISRVYVDFRAEGGGQFGGHMGDAVAAAWVAWRGRASPGGVAVVVAPRHPATRAVTVRADFGNGDRALRPGLLLDVALLRPQRQALVLPELAVVQVGRESFVYRVKPDGSVERADVVLGNRHDGKVEVRDGVKAGERIVIEGTGKLRPGQKIRDAGRDADGDAGTAGGAKRG